MNLITKPLNIERNRGRVKEILIVDDDQAIVKLLTACLEADYCCSSAASAEEALVLCHFNEFQLVITDITMPGMSGLDMLPQLKSLAPNSVVVMISGNQALESAIYALRLGAFDYLVKPFDLQQVKRVIKRAAEHYELITAKKLYEDHLEQLVAQRTAELDDALVSLENAYRSTLTALTSALEARDLETAGHSERVVRFSLRLGLALGLNATQMKSLEFGALLHDIGKIGVPDSILRKPAKLTEEEWRLMRKHPAHGEQIIKGIEFLEGAAKVVGQHHERWDGTGYPRGLQGEQIDLGARIFAVADTFDAITSDRVYHRARDYDAALLELEKYSGLQFDANVIRAFKQIAPAEWNLIRKNLVVNSQPLTQHHEQNHPYLTTQLAMAH